MPSFISTAAIAITGLLAVLPSVAAHGYILGITAGGKTYAGTDPNWYYQATKPARAGWYAQNLDNGYIEPAAYTDPVSIR